MLCMLQWCISTDFCFGSSDFCCCENCLADYTPGIQDAMSSSGDKLPLKRRKIGGAPGKENKKSNVPPKKQLLLKKNKQRSVEITAEGTLAELSKGYVPLNMEKNMVWAVNVFCEWQ